MSSLFGSRDHRDVQELILSFLPATKIARASTVNRFFHSLIRDSDRLQRIIFCYVHRIPSHIVDRYKGRPSRDLYEYQQGRYHLAPTSVRYITVKYECWKEKIENGILTLHLSGEMENRKSWGHSRKDIDWGTPRPPSSDFEHTAQHILLDGWKQEKGQFERGDGETTRGRSQYFSSGLSFEVSCIEEVTICCHLLLTIKGPPVSNTEVIARENLVHFAYTEFGEDATVLFVGLTVVVVSVNVFQFRNGPFVCQEYIVYDWRAGVAIGKISLPFYRPPSSYPTFVDCKGILVVIRHYNRDQTVPGNNTVTLYPIPTVPPATRSTSLHQLACQIPILDPCHVSCEAFGVNVGGSDSNEGSQIELVRLDDDRMLFVEEWQDDEDTHRVEASFALPDLADCLQALQPPPNSPTSPGSRAPPPIQFDRSARCWLGVEYQGDATHQVYQDLNGWFVFHGRLFTFHHMRIDKGVITVSFVVNDHNVTRSSVMNIREARQGRGGVGATSNDVFVIPYDSEIDKLASFSTKEHQVRGTANRSRKVTMRDFVFDQGYDAPWPHSTFRFKKALCDQDTIVIAVSFWDSHLEESPDERSIEIEQSIYWVLDFAGRDLGEEAQVYERRFVSDDD